MAIINKDKFLKEIASLVRKGEMVFEAADRPSLEMGGRQVYVGSVSFDLDLGELTYTVQNRAGDTLASAHGVRPLSGLDGKSLAAVTGAVRKYSDLRLDRERNLVNVESRVKAVTASPKKFAPSL